MLRVDMNGNALPTGYDPAKIRKFIAEWKAATSEARTAQSCFRDLCIALDVPEPPKGAADPGYQFEMPVAVPADEKVEKKFADVYKRATFVWENKGLRASRGGQRWLDGMRKAYEQGKRYAKFLAPTEPEQKRPPILVVFDVGNVIWIWNTFSSGGRGDYGTFEDRYEIAFDDLDRPDVFKRLRLAMTDPQALNPRREAGRITLEIAKSLGKLAAVLEAQPGVVGTSDEEEAGERIARFMMASVFTMFAEDMALLGDTGEKPFQNDLAVRWQEQPDKFVPEVTALWKLMDTGGSDRQLGRVLQFNGGLFRNVPVLPLQQHQIAILAQAASYDWTEVEPSIFGTLLEQALKKKERARLGAYFTPREYIERVVVPTIVEPLRAEWEEVNARAQQFARLAQEQAELRTPEGKTKARSLRKQANDEIVSFLERLRQVTVLDPACGTGNFLYVSMDLIKQIEREVLTALSDIGDTQGFLTAALVQPDQFYGIEIKAWSKEIAELVLWIGYLQWWRRERGKATPPEPVLRAAGHIEHRDAVLACDPIDAVVAEDGTARFVKRDGKGPKRLPIVGASAVVERYATARQADWPETEFAVSNPPFVGNKRMRELLPAGYVDALREAYAGGPRPVGGDVDFVAYWWHKAAELLQSETSKLKRFGFITTNSIRQTQSGAVLRDQLATGNLLLHFACPDHPWVDPGQELGRAAVRISMTVVRKSAELGAREPTYVEDLDAKKDSRVLLEPVLGAVKRRRAQDTALGEAAIAREVRLSAPRKGQINPDLSVGADVTKAHRLQANEDMCFQGVNLVGEGFRLDADEARSLGVDLNHRPEQLRRYVTGKGLLQPPKERWVVDFFGLTEGEAQAACPALFDHLVREVKPMRDSNAREAYRKRWWVFGEPRPAMRRALAGLQAYFVTVETAKHRLFVRLDPDVIPDHKLYAVTSGDAFVLGVLSSTVHAAWALRAGGRNGVGNDPTWTNTRTFAPFPFPDATQEQRARIGDLASRIEDAHAFALSPEGKRDVSLTDVYNLVARLRAERQGLSTLTTEERQAIAELGCATLLHLHDQLDGEVLAAYGWPNDIAEADLLTRLVELNAARAGEEATGTVRWLRRAYQEPLFLARTKGSQAPLPVGIAATATGQDTSIITRPVWVSGESREDAKAQTAAIRSVLARAPAPMTVEEIVASLDKPARAKVAPAVERHLGALEGIGAVVSMKRGDAEAWTLAEA